MVNGLVGLAILFFILALVSALLGARGIAGISMSIAKWLIILFIVLAILALLFKPSLPHFSSSCRWHPMVE